MTLDVAGGDGVQVVMRARDVHPVSLGPGERLVFGRGLDEAVPDDRPRGVTTLRVPGCAPHVSAILAEVVVGTEAAWIRWWGANEGRLSSLLSAPGGARRVTLVRDMSAMLDEGKNELLVLSGKQVGNLFADLEVTFVVTGTATAEPARPVSLSGDGRTEAKPHVRDRKLVRHSKEWFVALALAEPWLIGEDAAPFPPTNRLIYQRIRQWRRGDAWNLEKSQRVDDAIRAVSKVAFGELEDPYGEARASRIQNPRFAVGKRVAEYRLVTAEELDEVERAARSHG